MGVIPECSADQGNEPVMTMKEVERVEKATRLCG